jgi:hypothetical protein
MNTELGSIMDECESGRLLRCQMNNSWQPISKRPLTGRSDGVGEVRQAEQGNISGRLGLFAGATGGILQRILACMWPDLFPYPPHATGWRL